MTDIDTKELVIFLIILNDIQKQMGVVLKWLLQEFLYRKILVILMKILLIDEITGMLQVMRRILDVHVALDKDISPALKEIVIVWKGSKIMIPLLVTILTGLIASYAWVKDHIKP